MVALLLKTSVSSGDEAGEARDRGAHAPSTCRLDGSLVVPVTSPLCAVAMDTLQMTERRPRKISDLGSGS